MNYKLAIPVLALFILIAAASSVQAQIAATIEVKDTNGNPIDGMTVMVGTKVIAYAYYEDLVGSSSATGKIDVYLNKGSGFNLVQTLWSGTVNDGQTITSPQFTMNELGTYEFRWTVRFGAEGQCVETAQARTTAFSAPEPATLAGLAMGLSALGLFAFKKRRK